MPLKSTEMPPPRSGGCMPLNTEPSAWGKRQQEF
jgi:hypothetical protein